MSMAMVCASLGQTFAECIFGDSETIWALSVRDKINKPAGIHRVPSLAEQDQKTYGQNFPTCLKQSTFQ